MFEETQVCMTCGRPVDGVIYCSDECESVDSNSPSLSSAPSSAYPSPYLHSMHTANLDVPSLAPSALGHRPQLSISSSESGWSTLITDDEEGDPCFYAASDYNSDVISLDVPASKSNVHSGLAYTRRPSSTNHRSTVPLLLRKQSSVASSSVSNLSVVSHSFSSPYYAEDDASSTCFSEDLIEDSERECTPSMAASQRKRNRVSLPAYFSLLHGSISTNSGSPSGSPRPSRRVPSALQSLSRSLHASPTTPRAPHSTTVLPVAATNEPEPRGRGRRREREPDARSASSRRDTERSPPRHISRQGLTATQRARIDSVEKVAEWVSSSPVISQMQQHRKYAVKLPEPHAQRRNSSPRPTKPKYEFAEALAKSLMGCAIADEEEEVEISRVVSEQERRGRRRMEELDEPIREDAPGIGSGRTGLQARARGRVGTVRALGRH